MNNPWIAFVHEAWSAAVAAWDDALEQATSLYPTEVAEWTAANPRPTYKQFLTGLKGAA